MFGINLIAIFASTLLITNGLNFMWTRSVYLEAGKEDIRTEVMTGTLKALGLKSKLERKMRQVNARAAKGMITKEERAQIAYATAIELINANSIALEDCKVPEVIRHGLGDIK